MNRNILIVTLKLGRNYGGILQAFALQQVIKQLGYEAVTTGSSGSPLRRTIEFFPLIERSVRKLMKKEYAPFKETSAHTSKFIRQHIQVESFTQSLKRAFLGQYGTIVTGSDQVWRKAYAYFPHTFLAFPAPGANKISYAASFGKDDLNEYNIWDSHFVGRHLRFFSAVSVREDSGVGLISDRWGVSAESHIDPTLLLDKSDYLKLISDKNSEDVKKPDRIFYYCLDDSLFKQDLLSKIKQEMNLDHFSLIDGHLNGGRPLPPVEEWLRSFRDAKFVITDSFHGMVFSIIFEKPFLVIGNKERGIARFSSLLRMLKLESRVLDIEDEFFLKRALEVLRQQIDWLTVGIILAENKSKAFKFLTEQLGKS